MSPSHVLQPTYDRLKRAIMEGAWPQNTRLEAVRIADEYGVSVTPVRESLSLLAGEGLIAARPGEGYRTKILGIRDLAELLATNAVLVEAAAACNSAAGPDVVLQDAGDGLAYADAVSLFFSAIATRSGNRVLADFIDRISNRLHQIRAAEHHVLDDLEAELQQLIRLSCVTTSLLVEAVNRYHERRTRFIKELAALLV